MPDVPGAVADTTTADLELPEPTADFTWTPAQPMPGQDVAFDGSSSTDAISGAAAPDLTYAWDLDGDGSYDDATGVDATTSSQRRAPSTWA